MFDSNDFLKTELSKSADGMQFEFSGSAAGLNNVSSLWEVTGGEHDPHTFTGDAAYAMIQLSERALIRSKGWWIGFGSGRREAYEGNGDAAQLWIDANADGWSKQDYSPVANSVLIDINWQAVGRDFSFCVGKLTGDGSLAFRRITANDYAAHSARGSFDGESFSGMMKIVSATTDTGRVIGKGWSVDAQAKFQVGSRWKGQATVEGIAGSLVWRDLRVMDGYMTSLEAFAGSDGFLHDNGGITGANRQEDLRCRLNPYMRLDLIRSGKIDLLLSIACRVGDRTTSSVGLAWPQTGNWKPYFRLYSIENRVEVGAIGRGWQFRISGDDWPFGSSKHAEISLSAIPVSF